MIDNDSIKGELAWCFAEENDAIALGGAAPDCAERLAAFHASFDAECARMWDGGADLGATVTSNR